MPAQEDAPVLLPPQMPLLHFPHAQTWTVGDPVPPGVARGGSEPVPPAPEPQQTHGAPGVDRPGAPRDPYALLPVAEPGAGRPLGSRLGQERGPEDQPPFEPWSIIGQGSVESRQGRVQPLTFTGSDVHSRYARTALFGGEAADSEIGTLSEQDRFAKVLGQTQMHHRLRHHRVLRHDVP